MTNSASLPVELLEILSLLDATRKDLNMCGTAAIHLLTKSIYYLSQTPPFLTVSESIASSLLRLANEKILAFNYNDVPICWRRMYTDSTILKVIAILGVSRSLEGEEVILDAIRSLDMVLIVAGSPGEQRRAIVFQLIDLLQKKLPRLSDVEPPLKRLKTTASILKSTISPTITRPILRLSTSPSISEFHQLIQKPFIITGGALDWPAIKSWSSLSYLQNIAGEGRVVPVEVGGNYTTGDWSQKIVPFSKFLSSLASNEEKLYLAQHDLFRQIPQLEKDIVVPDLIYCRPEDSSSQFEAPSNENRMVMNAWLGPEGTVSPAHTDPYFNCYTQVVGKKWIWTAPPSVSNSLYTFGSTLSPLPSTLEDEGIDEEDSSTSHYMTNTSRIDVSLPADAELLKRYPKFLKEVIPVAEQEILKPGDVLFMPPGWWHSMKSLDVSFSVSIWF